MALSADAIFAATHDDQQAIQRCMHRNAIVIPEVGLICGRSIIAIKNRGVLPLKVCWSSGHMPRKSLHLLLKALPLISPTQPIELHIIGFGQYTKRWKNLATRLFVNDMIVWHGNKSHQDALQLMSQTHLFVITSIVDLTSTVLLEALSLGLPIITLNLCGFSNVVTEECGIKIDVHSERQVISDIAAAINTLANDEPLRLRMAHAALHRAQDYTWEKKAMQISQLYTNAIHAHKQ